MLQQTLEKQKEEPGRKEKQVFLAQSDGLYHVWESKKNCPEEKESVEKIGRKNSLPSR